MATHSFTPTVIPPTVTWVQYSSTLEDFQGELLATGVAGDIQVLEDPANPGRALVLHNGYQLTVVNPTQWVSCDGSWSVNNDSDMQGTTNGGWTPVP